MTTSGDRVTRLRQRGPSERHEWTLLTLALVAYGTGALFLLTFMAGAITLPTAFGSTGPVPLDLHATFTLPATAGSHHYSGSASIADGVTVTATGARAAVAGATVLSRVLLHLAPLLWSATVCITATAIGLALARLRARDVARPASRPLQVAAIALGIGSTSAQIASAVALTRIGHVAWVGRDDIDGFTATPDTLFNPAPITIAVALLAIVLIIRRSEPGPVPADAGSGEVAAEPAAAHGSRS